MKILPLEPALASIEWQAHELWNFAEATASHCGLHRPASRRLLRDMAVALLGLSVTYSAAERRLQERATTNGNT